MNKRTKYPRTLHLPYSPGSTTDDKKLSSTKHFSGKSVIVTEKMDGENTTIYNFGTHARSLESSHHPSRSRVKALQASLSIPNGWRICGENLYAAYTMKPFPATSRFFLSGGRIHA